jgi:hypothetical protein
LAKRADAAASSEDIGASAACAAVQAQITKRPGKSRMNLGTPVSLR